MQKQEYSQAEADLQLSRWIWATTKGDESAFSLLYAATVNLLYGLAYRITRSNEMAEEAVENAYFYVWQNAQKFNVLRGTPIKWMMVICRSQALMLLRSRDTNTVVYTDDDSYADEAEAEADPQLLLCAIEEKSALHAALKALDADSRQILTLAFFRGLTYSEISSQLDMPLGTVKTKMRYTMVFLREKLKTLRCSNVR
ncbi:RNA polymerase sigma factor [Noviherbaspirillum aerium]|uniref:RNA polymerase sigma factor n=1 Tax=Noviherbaspirillum aerium TaxID=2588497 RepID=UPI00124D6436|nr:sigma-70 family RNA polymerase sigma factor [Noviherbaspirillum aerium]